MRRLVTFAATLLIFKTVTTLDTIDFLSDEFIDFINSNQSLWRAGRNFRRDIPLEYIKLLAGTIHDNGTKNDEILDGAPPYDEAMNTDSALPENFDARIKWSNCPIMNQVRDQGSCGSCWAVAAVAAMTDRYCITSKGKENFNFAAGDVLSCCLNCGSGCSGGVLQNAWAYCKRNGIVSGGEYESNVGCIPYQIPPCDHRFSPNRLEPCGHNVKTPTCKTVCAKDHEQSYMSDKKKCTMVYTIKQEYVLKDIYNRGPVTTSFDVYADFLHYNTGVYKYVTGKKIGRHSVKLMGWGVEGGVKYWLAANTWNESWGDKGFFKILRDANHCGIEETIVAGI